jgi:hypothetical protein
MLEAGETLLQTRELLAATGSNITAEVLRGQGDFYEFSHYPDGDVFDPDTGSQYYYHAHRTGHAEHGHFHTFIRRAAGPGLAPLPTHLVAISMDAYGDPTALFPVNRWVTGETWTPAETLVRLLPRFAVRHAIPHPRVNDWIGALLQAFRPDIEALLAHRDQVIAREAEKRDPAAVLEDRRIEVVGRVLINPDERVARLRGLLG